MTPIEIDKALCDIAFNIINECKERIERADKTNKTEIKALKIEEGMYSLAPRAGLLTHAKSREGMLETRKNKVLPTILPRYPEIKAVYESLDEDKKNIFVAALQAELFMRYSCYDNNLAELSRARETGDAAREFEFAIKVGAMKRTFDAWEDWRRENDIFPGIFKEKN